MGLILDFTIAKQCDNKGLKQPQKIPSSRYHIAHIKFAKAITIFYQIVFAFRKIK